MEEALKLSTEQKLQQRLTPLQVQFVKMLEMTGPEIEDEIRRVVDENPALEISENDSSNDVPTSDNNDFSESFNESAEQMQLADYRSEDDIPSYRLEAHNYSVNDKYFEPIAVASDESLIESLSSQLSEHNLDETQMTIAQYIIGNIDDNGYLTRDLAAISDDLAINAGLDVKREDVKAIFDTIRSLDPPGVGAVDLRDCLLLQLQRKNTSEAERDATEIVADYFDLFSKRHFDRLMSMMGIDAERLKKAMAVIRTLNPKPGSSVAESSDNDRTRHIIPDFSVETDDENNITLTLLNNIPDLQIEATFSETALDAPSGKSHREREAATFIKQKRDDASNFIKIIKMRQETMFRIMSAIIKLQKDFFLTDDESLIHPMILRDIAAITGYDLSVISRATAGKYVLTQRGVYPLKLFFNERPKEDDDTSSHEILAVLEDIIARENKQRPLSDEAITAQLTSKGYDIARRTVAKYRERLGFPVARLRKEI